MQGENNRGRSQGTQGLLCTEVAVTTLGTGSHKMTIHRACDPGITGWSPLALHDADHFSDLSSEDLIEREGKSYLEKHRLERDSITEWSSPPNSGALLFLAS